MNILTISALALIAVPSLLAHRAHAVEQKRTAVLVHGAVLDGSGWRPVYDILRAKGFDVAVAQLPLTGLEDDVAAVKSLIDHQDGQVVLVGSSYGGAVISAAGPDSKVDALVYVAALQPDKGESVADLNARWPMPGHPKDLGNGMMIVDPAHFAEDVAADLPKEQSAFLAASQRPTSVSIYTAKLAEVGWHDKPVYGIVAAGDRTLSPDMQRFVYKRSGAKTIELDTAHLPHISQPQAVADFIVEALTRP